MDYLYNFYLELMKSQSLLEPLRESSSPRAARQLIHNEGPQHYSDGIFEDIEKLDEVGPDAAGEEMRPVVENVEIEAVGFDDDRTVEEQLIDIKIETVEEEEQEFLVEKLEPSDHSEEEEEFRGFDEPVPVKLTVVGSGVKRSTRKAKNTVPKLHIVETIPNKCYVCDTVCESEDLFDVHLVIHNYMLPHKCVDCSTEKAPVVIKTLVLLNKHFESHGFNYVCEYCPLRFRSYPPLYDHSRNFHTEQKEGFNCDICGQIFVEIRKFQKHVRAHRNQDSQRYKCATCGKTFQTGTILRRHEGIHKKESTLICPFCQRTFNHEANFKQHKMRHLQQQQQEQNGYPCTVCETHFTNAVDLRNHMKQHFPDDPLYNTKTDILPLNLRDSSSYPRPCEEANCKYIAPSYPLMWSHYKNHYKMYDCQDCHRKFATATILKNHINVIHKKIRKYRCEICEKQFGYQHKFKEHMNMHLGIKSRQCRYCDKSFTHSSNLIVHERIHTNTKPYKCDICGSAHVTTSALKKHKKTHRKNESGTDAGGDDNVEEEEHILAEDPDEGQLIYFMESEGAVVVEEEVSVGDLSDVLEEA